MQFFLSELYTLLLFLVFIYSYLHIEEYIDVVLNYNFFLFTWSLVDEVFSSVPNYVSKIQWKYYYVYLYLILSTPYMVHYVLNSRQDSFLYRLFHILLNNIAVRILFILPFEKVIIPLPPAAATAATVTNFDDDNDDHMPSNRDIIPREPVVAGIPAHVTRLVYAARGLPRSPTAGATTIAAVGEFTNEAPTPEGVANLDFLRPRTFPTGRFYESLYVINRWIELNDHTKLTILSPGFNNYFETEPVTLSKSVLLELFTVDRTKRLKDLLRYLNDPESPEEATYKLATALTFFILKGLNIQDDIDSRADSAFQFIQPLFVNVLRTNRDSLVCDFVLYHILLDFPTVDLVLDNDVDRNGINWMILQEEPEFYRAMEEFKKNEFMKPHPPSSSPSSSFSFSSSSSSSSNSSDDESEREHLIQEILANRYLNAVLNELTDISEILGDQTRKMYASDTLSSQGNAPHLNLVPRSDLTTEELIASVLPNITSEIPEEVPATGEETTGSAAAAAAAAHAHAPDHAPAPAPGRGPTRNEFYYGLYNDVPSSGETVSEYLGRSIIYPSDLDCMNAVRNQEQTTELSDRLEIVGYETRSFEKTVEIETEEPVTTQGQQSATNPPPEDHQEQTSEVQKPQATEANPRIFDTVSEDWNSLRYEPSDADDLGDLLYGAIPASFEDIVPEMRLTEAGVLKRLEVLIDDPVTRWLNNLYSSSVQGLTSPIVKKKLQRVRNAFLMVILSIKAYHKHVIQYEKGYALKRLVEVVKMHGEELRAANRRNADCVEKYPLTWTGFVSTKPIINEAARVSWTLKHVYDRFSSFDLSYQKKLYKKTVYNAYRDTFTLCNDSREFEEGLRRGDNT